MGTPPHCATGIGGALPPKRDLHRFVRWPKYVRLQRQRRVLNQRLKVRLACSRTPDTALPQMLL